VATREVIRISVEPGSKKVIADEAGANGMTEQWVASRVYEWFAKQDDVLKKGILGVLPKGYELDVARLALERMTQRQGKK
jgi:hypothetical protein